MVGTVHAVYREWASGSDLNQIRRLKERTEAINKTLVEFAEKLENTILLNIMVSATPRP